MSSYDYLIVKLPMKKDYYYNFYAWYFETV